MTVGELRELIKNIPDEHEVILYHGLVDGTDRYEMFDVGMTHLEWEGAFTIETGDLTGDG